MRVKQPKSHKKAASIVAIGAVAVLMLSGTFAWFSGTIHAQNEFIGSATPTPPPGNNPVVLHDDFENPKKDVYVENTGTTPVYVRIQLSEAMDLTTNVVPSPIPTDMWDIHAPDKAESPLMHEDLGHTEPAGASAGLKFHDYFTWTWGLPGDGTTYTYIPAGSGTDGLVQNKQAEIDAAASTKQTLPMTPGTAGNGVISVDYYVGTLATALKLTSNTQFVGWVYDTDGWAYWSQPLLPGTATGPIISNVATAASLAGTNYWYIIDVAMESVDAADLPTWIRAASDPNGQTMLTTIGGIPVPTP